MTRLSLTRRPVGTLAMLSLLAWHPGTSFAQGPELPSENGALVTAIDHLEDGVFEISIGPAVLEADGPHLRLPIQLTTVPFDGWLHGFEWEITDGDGQKLPDELLHHFNLIDPDRRELFSPTARRVMAAGRETQKEEIPHLLGYRVEAGTRLLVVAMLASPARRDYEDVYLRLRIFYTRAGEGLLEPRDVQLFYIDVMGPVGAKDFPVPPGHTAQSWEGSPAVDGRILAIGAHLHDYATEIRIEDLTTGKVVWRTEPDVDDTGRVLSVPTTHLWWRGGVHIRKDHRYRVTAEYDNPMSHDAPHAGMGAVGGLFLPSGDAEWPEFDRENPDYLADLRNTLEAPEKAKEHSHHQHGAGGAP